MYTTQEIETFIKARLPENIRLVQTWETLSKKDFITVLFNQVGTKIHRAVDIYQNEERINLKVSSIYSYDKDYTSEKTKYEDSTECLLTWLNSFLPNVFSKTITRQPQTKTDYKQVKSVVPDAPYYFWDNLIVSNYTESVFNILRIEINVAGQVRYLDLITDSFSKRFLGLGGTSDKTTDFTISINMCKTYSIVAYMEDAS